MSSSQPKRSSRVQENLTEKAIKVTEIPSDWLFLFYFQCNGTFSWVRPDSPRWPEGFSNDAKISLNKGDIVKIKCGPENIPLVVEFKMIGTEKKINLGMSNMCVKKNDGINFSRLNASEIIRNYNKRNLPEDDDYDRNCFERENRSPEIASQTQIRKPKLFSEFDDPEIADDPNIECALIEEFLDYRQAKNKNSLAATSSGPSSSSDEVIASVS